MTTRIARSALAYLAVVGVLAATASPLLAALDTIRAALAQPGGALSALVAMAVLA